MRCEELYRMDQIRNIVGLNDTALGSVYITSEIETWGRSDVSFMKIISL
jgi:hypothetical protein